MHALFNEIISDEEPRRLVRRKVLGHELFTGVFNESILHGDSWYPGNRLPPEYPHPVNAVIGWYRRTKFPFDGVQSLYWEERVMQGKGKKKSGNGRATGKNNGRSGKNGNGKRSKSSKKVRRSGGRSRFTMDIFNEEVMENAYYTCHNIMDVLKCRGFPWPDAQKKKKKRKN